MQSLLEIETLSWPELVRLCGTPAKAKQRVADGEFRRVVHGIYVRADVGDTPQTRAACLRQALPEDVVLSHWAAPWVLGLDVLPRTRDGDGGWVDTIDAVVPRGRHLERRDGFRPHTALVSDDDLVVIEGLRIVTPARAVVDVARDFGVIEGVACGDAVLRAGVTDVTRIEDAVDRAGGLRWVTRAREVVPLLNPRCESLMESRLRTRTHLVGGPLMGAQVDLYDETGTHYGRADLYEQGVCFEYDGRAERLEKAKFVNDRTRGNNISDLEVEVRRFTGESYYKSTDAQLLGIWRRAREVASQRKRPRLRFGRDTLRPPAMTPLRSVAEERRASREQAA